LTPREDHRASFHPDNWAQSNDTLDEGNILWRQYLVLIDLYKYYLDAAWRTSVWYYGVTGALLAYFFAHAHDTNAFLRWILPFSSSVSWVLSLLHWRGLPQLIQLRDWLEEISEQLRLPGRPHVEFGAAFVLMNAIMFSVAGVAILIPFFVALH
jgi:hypothetical protein